MFHKYIDARKSIVKQRYKILLNKNKKKKFADPKNMGVNIDKNEYYEIILSNSAHPENIK